MALRLYIPSQEYKYYKKKQQKRLRKRPVLATLLELLYHDIRRGPISALRGFVTGVRGTGRRRASARWCGLGGRTRFCSRVESVSRTAHLQVRFLPQHDPVRLIAGRSRCSRRFCFRCASATCHIGRAAFALHFALAALMCTTAPRLYNCMCIARFCIMSLIFFLPTSSTTSARRLLLPSAGSRVRRLATLMYVQLILRARALSRSRSGLYRNSLRRFGRGAERIRSRSARCCDVFVFDFMVAT